MAQRVRAGVCVAALLPGPRAQRRGRPYSGAWCLLLRRRSSWSEEGAAHLERAVFVVVRAVLLSSTSAAKDLGLRVHVVGAGVHVQLAERCDRAHEVRLTRTDVESRRYTQNDGSAQPRRGDDHLAVPTGVNRQLLADPVGLAAVGTTCGPSGPPWPPLSAPSCGRCGRRTGCCTALAGGRRARTGMKSARTRSHSGSTAAYSLRRGASLGGHRRAP